MDVVCSKFSISASSYLELLERHEGLLIDSRDFVVGQIQPSDSARLFKDLLADETDSVSGQSQSVQSLQTGQSVGVQFVDVVFAQVQGPQRGRHGFDGVMRNPAELIGLQGQISDRGSRKIRRGIARENVSGKREIILKVPFTLRAEEAKKPLQIRPCFSS